MKATKSISRVLLIVLAVGCGGSVSLKAQNSDQRAFFANVKDVVEELSTRAQNYYDNNVATVERQLKAIPAEMSKSELESKEQRLQATQSELERLTALEKQAHQEMAAHVNSLLQSRCNPLAIEELKTFDDTSLRPSIDLLQDYAGYCSGLRAPLEKLKAALESNGWNRLEESSAALQQFDKEWESTAYLNYINGLGNDGIPFLNSCVKKVVSMRLRGFSNCQNDFMQLLENLTPASVAVNSHYSEIVSINRKIAECNRIISELSRDLSVESSNNELYNELDKERYEVVEKWYDILEAKDQVILDACRYCLSNPLDELGNYQWMRSQVEPLLDKVYHKSYKARSTRYATLLADYERHSNELAGFLKRVSPYATTAGGVTPEDKTEILSSLRSLDYYGSYYAGRTDSKAVSSPHLDSIIGEFEQLLSKNFENAKEQYTTLVSEVKADSPSVSDLSQMEAAKKSVEEKLFATFTVNGVSFKMRIVAGGTFTMGATAEQGNEADSDEKPAHQVTLSSFSIGQTEVTQELWEAVMGSNPSNWKGSKLPVEEVSWDDCQEFIKKLNALTGQNFRLPTEAEWEYAARGGSQSRGYKYSGSNDIDDVAWYDGNSGRQTHDVATKQPNELGLFDMSGNVWEWCQDWYGENYYGSSPSSNPTGPASGSFRVDRGGSWSNFARGCRVAYRGRSSAGGCGSHLGLRLAL